LPYFRFSQIGSKIANPSKCKIFSTIEKRIFRLLRGKNIFAAKKIPKKETRGINKFFYGYTSKIYLIIQKEKVFTIFWELNPWNLCGS
jgi:hypothetical protein